MTFKLLEDRDGKPRLFDDLGDLAEYLVSEDDFGHDGYDDFIRETCGDPMTVFGIHFDPVYILKELDPIAYNCGFWDYIEGEIEDKRYEVERELEWQLSEPGDTAEYDVYEIVAIGDEDEDEES